ncbi:MAG: STAS domain-containing protein [Verrucomicrobia bacterium]|nr:STAS domain-containing protein [Verrucomicrobiota bacterium]MBU4290137.1 STAS domain-containing protein [Verrucomicrobiota bacterium]MBU4428095.1 STAS domain-containing protein [Verrucomicrobiota bacterium]MCG2681459.1 STAS domain-containing protein [Kiritimatiellia bacterium]
MNCELTASKINPQVNLMALSGRLAVETEAQVRPLLVQAIQKSPHGLIIDLKAVNFVTSAGLRLLLEVYKSAASSGTRIAMIRPQPEIYKLFKLASLDTTFSVHETEDEAVKAIGG